MNILSDVNRRRFLRLGAAGGAGFLAEDWSALSRTSTTIQASVSNETAPWFEATIPELQTLMTAGKLSSRELTVGYLHQIDRLNPLLHAAIETNPNAVAVATQLDNERHRGRARGPLHGIPVLVKDNIATADNMQTTAGSLALMNSKVPGDAPVIAKLRAAGAVILGKANLGEWANFRGFPPTYGWSARGGLTRCPYVLDFEPWGSSSGSAVGAAANLCAAAVGTETDGSIVGPAGNNAVVGLKPTVGLLSQDRIIPIAHSQDTAGPMARTVVDVAILLGIMQAVPEDYTVYLDRSALKGARIGLDVRYFDPSGIGGDSETVSMVNNTVLPLLTSLGAILIPTDTGNCLDYGNEEFTVLLYEFKIQIAEYLATLGHNSMRTLADLITFNIAHCPQEMKYFGQELFEIAEGGISHSDYVAARAKCLQLSRVQGIDKSLNEQQLDAILAPGFSWATTPAAVAGYPNIGIPIGFRTEDGMWGIKAHSPTSICLYSGAMQERKLLAYAYAIEQALKGRKPPKYLGNVAPGLPDAEICANLPKTSPGKAGLPHLPRRRW